MKTAVQDEMNFLIERLKRDQSSDGTWNYTFDTGVLTDAYMIILLRSLEIDDENLITALTERIISKQEENGAWKLFRDEREGNLSRTIEAYYGLLYSGYYGYKDKEIILARKFILTHGGLEKAGMFTKIMLTITGQYSWPLFFPFPIEIMLLPIQLPVNIYDISVFGRANIVPILILGNKKFQLKTDRSPDLSSIRGNDRSETLFTDEYSKEWGNYFSKLLSSIQTDDRMFEKRALYEAEQYLLNRTEPDGTLLSYFSSTFLMIFALISLGSRKESPVIKKAVDGLKAMQSTVNDRHVHIQYTTADVWNTSLISWALQQAGVQEGEEVILKASRYLFSRQHYKYGDWIIHNPHAFPGGFGFSDINTLNPDVDDTTASLRAMIHLISQHKAYKGTWERGVQWALSMQNEDGGWPSFEREVNKSYLSWLPVQGGDFILKDPSCADLTGRTLEFLGNYTNLNSEHRSIRRGKKWLKKTQESDGSWYSRWGICYIYGSWAAVTGLLATGENPNSKTIKKAVKWLETIQNDDGGWGESCLSDTHQSYVPLGESTLVDTAWALDALIAASTEETEVIHRGIKFLLKNNQRKTWLEDYPKGQGMGGVFYIHYESYRYIWPLITFSHYQQKYIE